MNSLSVEDKNAIEAKPGGFVLWAVRGKRSSEPTVRRLFLIIRDVLGVSNDAKA